MTPPDLPTIAAVVASTILLAAIFSVFLRIQLQRLSSVHDRLSNSLQGISDGHHDVKAALSFGHRELKTAVDSIIAAMELPEQPTAGEELNSIQTNFDGINANLEKAVTSIIQEVRSQQRVLANAIDTKFEEQSRQALTVIEDSLRRELREVVLTPEATDIFLKKAGVLIGQAMRTMGQYQRIVIEQQSSNVLETVETKVNSAIDDVVGDVKDLKSRVEALPLALVPSSSRGGGDSSISLAPSAPLSHVKLDDLLSPSADSENKSKRRTK